MNVATPEVGQRAEPRTYGPITSETIVRYSAASGDLNPMHYDKDFAQQAGLPDRVLAGHELRRAPGLLPL